jgi:hypothetical protein
MHRSQTGEQRPNQNVNEIKAVRVVEPGGIEPPTSSMPFKRSPN